MEQGEVEEKVRKLEKENEELRNSMLYLRAELENVKKLMEKEVTIAKSQTAERILLRFIDIYESLERALSSIGEEDKTIPVLSGLNMILKEMRKTLQEEGVKFIDSAGKKFDPFVHEAVGYVEDEEVEDGVVVAEVSRGYELHGKILRPPRVIVAKRKERN